WDRARPNRHQGFALPPESRHSRPPHCAPMNEPLRCIHNVHNVNAGTRGGHCVCACETQGYGLLDDESLDSKVEPIVDLRNGALFGHLVTLPCVRADGLGPLALETLVQNIVRRVPSSDLSSSPVVLRVWNEHQACTPALVHHLDD